MDEIDETSWSHFFGSEVTKMEDIPEYQISDRVMDVWESSTAIDEEVLRDTLYTDLVDQHKIPFLPSSCANTKTR